MNTVVSPRTWPALLADAWESTFARGALKSFSCRANEPIFKTNPAEQVGPLNNLFISLLVLDEPAAAKEVGAPLLALSDTILAGAEQPHRSFSAYTAVDALAVLNVAECCGLPRQWLSKPGARKSLEEMVKPALPHFAKSRKALRHRYALASLALGWPDLAHRFLRSQAPRNRVRPGRTFGDDVEGFIRYMSAALQQQATAADVLPAWLSFAAAFPQLRVARTLDWQELLWAARLYYVHFEGLSAETAGQRLHALVRMPQRFWN